jgi:CBS domain containing-hemolysin-like protein
MRTLTAYTLDQIDHLVQPAEFQDATLKSPALSVFTDFRTSNPMLLDEDTPALEAEDMMRHEHSQLKLIVDSSREMVGVLSSDQFSSQNLMRLVSKDVKAKDLTVKDVMHPRAEVMGLSYAQLQHCTVGDVLNTLQKAGEPYAVVIDHENHQIRGIISARDITARLHIAPVQIEKAPTLLNMLNLASA